MDTVEINFGKLKGELVSVLMILLIILGYDIFCVVSTQKEIDSEFAELFALFSLLGLDNHYKFGTEE